MRTLLLVLLTSLPLPALAQSSLGISGGQLSLGLVEDEAGDHRGGMRALVDVDGRAFMYGSLGAEVRTRRSKPAPVLAGGMSTVSITSSPAAPLRIG